MKFVKLSIFALSLGMFAASCGNDNSEETTINNDTAMMAPEATAPMTTDTMMAAPAMADTTMMTTTPSGDTAVMIKK